MSSTLNDIVQYMIAAKPECKSVKWESFENGILILQEEASSQDLNEAVKKVLKPPKYNKLKANLNTAFYNIKHEPVFCFKVNPDACSTVFLCSQYYTEGVCMENCEVSFKVHSEKCPLIFYLSKPECFDEINDFFKSKFDKSEPFVNILCRYKSFLSLFSMQEISDQIVIKPGVFYVYFSSYYALYTKSHQANAIPSCSLHSSPQKSTSRGNTPVKSPFHTLKDSSKLVNLRISTGQVDKSPATFETLKASPKLVKLDKCNIRASVSDPNVSVNSLENKTFPVASLLVDFGNSEASDNPTSDIHTSDDSDMGTSSSDELIIIDEPRTSKSSARKVKNPYVKYSRYSKILNENKMLKAKLRVLNSKLSEALKKDLRNKKF